MNNDMCQAPFAQRWRNLFKTKQSLAAEKLQCTLGVLKVKSHDGQDAIGFEKLRFEMFSVNTRTQIRRFQIPQG